MDSMSDILSDLYSDLKGEILNNKYLLIYQIGKGTFATVWLALNFVDKKYYAIKMQDPEEYDNGNDEVDILKKIKNTNCEYINKMIEHFEFNDEDNCYVCMVFELMIGSAYDVVKYGKYSGGLPFGTVKTIIHQLLTAMSVLNNKYKTLHSDIKPENILIRGTSNKVNEIISAFNKNDKILQQLNKKNKINKKQIKKMVGGVKFDDIEKKYDGDKHKKDSELEYVNDSCIQNITSKLADFGNCRSLDYEMYDIQTRYYRAPEIILEYRYNHLCDMWSVGCVIYELLFGEMLFDPDSKRRFGRKRNHIYEMNKIIGKIPDELLNVSQRYSYFYKSNGLLKRVNHIDYKPLADILTEKLENKKNVSSEEIILTIDIMEKLLQYDPYKRLSPDAALKHKWFANIK